VPCWCSTGRMPDRPGAGGHRAATAGLGLSLRRNPGYLADTAPGTLVWSAILDCLRAGGAPLRGFSAERGAPQHVAYYSRGSAANARGLAPVPASGQRPRGRYACRRVRAVALPSVPSSAGHPSLRPDSCEWVPGREGAITCPWVGPEVTVGGIDEDTAVVSGFRRRVDVRVMGTAGRFFLHGTGPRAARRGSSFVVPLGPAKWREGAMRSPRWRLNAGERFVEPGPCHVHDQLPHGFSVGISASRMPPRPPGKRVS